MLLLSLLLVFIPGELVMKNGKLLSYQGEYKIEDNLVKFTSTKGAVLQLPISAVDFEKTKARDEAMKAEKKAENASALPDRGQREFQAFVADVPSRKFEMKKEVRVQEPVPEAMPVDEEENRLTEDSTVNYHPLGDELPDTIAKDLGSTHDDHENDEESKTTLYAKSQSEDQPPTEDLSKKEAQEVSRLEERRAYYLESYQRLKDRRNQIQLSLSKEREQDSKPSMTESDSGNWQKRRLSEINEEIRELEEKALAEGITLDF